MPITLGIFKSKHTKEIAQAAVLTGHEIIIHLPGTNLPQERGRKVPRSQLGISIKDATPESLTDIFHADISLRGKLTEKKRNP